MTLPRYQGKSPIVAIPHAGGGGEGRWWAAIADYITITDPTTTGDYVVWGSLGSVDGGSIERSSGGAAIVKASGGTMTLHQDSCGYVKLLVHEVLSGVL